MSAILSTNASGSFIPFVFRQNQRMTLALATHLFISPQNQPLLPVIGGIFKTNKISASSTAKKKHALCWRQLIYEVYFHCVHCTNTLHYTDKLKKRKEIMMNYKLMIIHSNKPKGVQCSGSTINVFAPVLYNPPICQTVHYYSRTLQLECWYQDPYL